MVGGDGDVVGLDSDPVQRLHPQHVAVGPGVGEDPRVGDAEALQVVGDEGGRRRVERQVEVDRVEAVAVEEVVALGARTASSRSAPGTLTVSSARLWSASTSVCMLGALGELEIGRGVGEGAAQLAEREGLADDLVVALGRVDAAVVAVVQLRVEPAYYERSSNGDDELCARLSWATQRPRR